MRYYELLYIVNPNLEDDRVKTIIDEIGKEINKYKVSIINHNLWGKNRLAYPINKNKYGIYLLLQFSAEQFNFLKEFERFLILNKSVIRHQLVRLDEAPAKAEDIEPVLTEIDSLENNSSEVPDIDDTQADIKDIEDTESTVEAENVDVEEVESEEEIKKEDK
ncbi:MAG: 30S ribosomal protein S6 [Candidatus Neomarinimicrobiota bacterium]